MNNLRNLALNLILCAAVSIAAYSLGKRDAEIEYRDQATKEMEVASQKRAEAARDAIKVESSVIRTEAEQERKAEAILDEIKVQINTPVGCDLPSDTVWLLEYARSPDLPPPSPHPDGKGQAAPTIGVDDLTVAYANSVSRYNRLMNRYNALVQWIEEHYDSNYNQ